MAVNKDFAKLEGKNLIRIKSFARANSEKLCKGKYGHEVIKIKEATALRYYGK